MADFREGSEVGNERLIRSFGDFDVSEMQNRGDDLEEIVLFIRGEANSIESVLHESACQREHSSEQKQSRP